MLKITVVNQCQKHLIWLEKTLEMWGNKREIQLYLKFFNDGIACLNYCIIENDIDIVLVDTEILPNGGIDLARQLKTINRYLLIILTATSLKDVLKGYEVKAFRYLLFDNIENSLPLALDEAKEELESEDEYFAFTFSKRKIRIHCNDILYFESSKRIIYIRTKVQMEGLFFYEQLTVLTERLNLSTFVRCHQSYLVNTHYIADVCDNHLILKKGYGQIPISKKYRKDIQVRFMNEKYLSNDFHFMPEEKQKMLY